MININRLTENEFDDIAPIPTDDLNSPSDKKKFIEQLTKLGAKENFIKF